MRVVRGYRFPENHYQGGYIYNIAQDTIRRRYRYQNWEICRRLHPIDYKRTDDFSWFEFGVCEGET